VELVRKRPPLRVTIEPRARLVVQHSDARTVRADVEEGKARFGLLGRLDFFSVGSFSKVFAIAKGTQFSVAADPSCSGGPCVTVALVEGRLEIETRRPVQIGPGTASSEAPTDAEDRTVTLSDPLDEGQTRTIALDPAQFALRYDSWEQADRYFAAELERAATAGEPQALMRALRNWLVILRLGDRNEQALAVAARGLDLAQREGDRVWVFRFLIDQAFSTWRLRRDRTALPLFEQAFAMTDVTDARVAPVDRAALYGRYGAIRFEARNRADPGADLDAAEQWLRRGLALRESLYAGRPALDLSLSHYDLGLLQRIGRNDLVEADRHLERAVQIRREVIGSRDDVVTAEMLADLAVTKEQLVRQRAGASSPVGDALLADFAQVRARFEDSLAMLRRLFPAGEHRSIAAVARRMADYHARLGDWLTEREQAGLAFVEYHEAERRYEESLAVWARVPGNTSAERRFALRGLGQVRLQLDQAANALPALRSALDLAARERCDALPEAPSPEWVAALLERLALAAQRSAQDAAAAQYRRRQALPDGGIVCPPPAPARAGAAP
jgi:hypothetical protein